MTGGAYREPPPGTRRLYRRFDPDMTDEEIDPWADEFVETIPGAAITQDQGARNTP